MKSRRRELLFRLLDELLAVEEAEIKEHDALVSAVSKGEIEAPATQPYLSPSVEIMTAKEVAGFLKVPVSRVYDLARTNRIPYLRPAGIRFIRFEKSELLEWLKSGRK